MQQPLCQFETSLMHKVVQVLSKRSLAKFMKPILSHAYNGRKSSFLKLGFGLATKPQG